MTSRKLSLERKIYLRWQTSERRRKLKKKAIEYKGGACGKCGYLKSVRSLVFHHLNPEEKDFTISMANGKSWEKIKTELDKCILLCANCHGEVHEEYDKINNENSLLNLRKIIPEKIPNAKSVIKNCSNCNKELKIFKSAEHKRNFCSRKCSSEVIYKTSWDSDEVMLEMIKNKSVQEIASHFKKSLSNTYEFLKKLKIKYSLQ